MDIRETYSQYILKRFGNTYIENALMNFYEFLIDPITKEILDDTAYSVMDTTDRSSKNAFKIIEEYRMFDMMNEQRFGDILAPYSRIIAQEQKRFKRYEELKANNK